MIFLLSRRFSLLFCFANSCARWLLVSVVAGSVQGYGEEEDERTVVGEAGEEQERQRHPLAQQSVFNFIRAHKNQLAHEFKEVDKEGSGAVTKAQVGGWVGG